MVNHKFHLNFKVAYILYVAYMLWRSWIRTNNWTVTVLSE